METFPPMHGAIPYLTMAGRSAEACDFYARTFGAEDGGRMPFPDGAPGLMHAQLSINGGALMMTDHAGMAAEGAAAPVARVGLGHLQLVVADGRAVWDRAIAAGCTVIAPYARQFWGDDWGLLEDPFGIRWGVMQSGEQP